MPPKPLAEDLARKKAERDKKNKLDQAVAILERPGGFEQAVDLAKDPVGTAKKLGQVAKETFYDPVKRFSAAVDPTSSASPMERAAGIAEGALYAADFLTPGVPEGAIARNLQREAMERALDREVAGYAARGGGLEYRGVLGVHGSPMPGLTQIQTRTGSQMMPDTPAAFSWRANNPAFPFDAGRLFDLGAYYATAESPLSSAARKPQIYITRAPGRAVANEFPPDMFVSADPLNVVGAIDLSEGKRGLRRAMLDVMTPAEKQKYRAAALQRQLDRGARERRSRVNQYAGDF